MGFSNFDFLKIKKVNIFFKLKTKFKYEHVLIWRIVGNNRMCKQDFASLNKLLDSFLFFGTFNSNFRMQSTHQNVCTLCSVHHIWVITVVAKKKKPSKNKLSFKLKYPLKANDFPFLVFSYDMCTMVWVHISSYIYWNALKFAWLRQSILLKHDFITNTKLNHFKLPYIPKINQCLSLSTSVNNWKFLFSSWKLYHSRYEVFMGQGGHILDSKFQDSCIARAFTKGQDKNCQILTNFQKSFSLKLHT